ncbi:MAG: GGDEF domain-containing protein [Terracidiphilus sp.]|jgi:diguanylate cyclase (GGDEF)-like protein
MKRLIALFAIVLGWAMAVSAAAPAPLTTLRQIHALSNAEASKGLPVAFEATVTYFRGYEHQLFVEDDGVGMFVSAPTDAKLAPGDRVLVRGKTLNSFNPIVIDDHVTLLRHGALSKPVAVNFDQMIRAETDCKLVTVRGVVRAADLVVSSPIPVRSIYLELLTEGGYFNANVDSDDESVLKGLLDAEVAVTGVVSEEFDSKMQVIGIRIHVQTLDGIQVLKRATASPWSLPVTPMDRVLAVYHTQDSTQRVRVHGTITYYVPSSAVVLQDGVRSIWIATQTEIPLRIGDVADATGFPDVHDGFLNLVHGEVQDTLTQAPVTPLPVTWNMLSPYGFASFGHHFDLVSIEGQVVTQVREAAQDEFVLSADGQLFSAFLRRTDDQLHDVGQIPIGARVRVTGICVRDNSSPYIPQVPFHILMRSFNDIEVVQNPSLLNIRNLMIVVGLLLAVVFAVVARGWAIERRVRRQSTSLALIEQRRSRILEKINGSHPLAEIVEEITELVSFKLCGAPCWCQIADGAQLGNCPPKLTGLRVVQSEIPAHAGPPLGTLFAAFDPLAKPSDSEAGALSMAVALTALAIETRRLYSDLVHRSEFDLLTDIHNRFSLGKYLDQQIAEARQNAGIFGLIYIDLDRFKQVNDIYGHQAGDLYLQEVALRMKRQLRGVDMLARLGGDEFAALLPRVRNRAKVEEIALRLERCFEEPFIIEGQTLRGSASIGIALYPEDATTTDGLLSAADAEMYVEKNSKMEAR